MQDSATVTRPRPAAGGDATVLPADPASLDAARLTHGGMMLWRAVIACGAPDGVLQDQFDCAETALALGHGEVARLLYDAAFLRAGFSPAAARAWRRIAARTGLWPDADLQARPVPAPDGFALTVAIADLRMLLAIRPDPPAQTPAQAAVRSWSALKAERGSLAGPAALPPSASASAPVPVPKLTPTPAAVQRPKRPIKPVPIEPPFDAQALAQLLAAVCAGLRRGDVAALTAALAQVHRDVLPRAEQRPQDYPGGSIVELAAMVAFNQLRSFFLVNHDLCWAPFGSAALFAAAAVQADAALGPYFTNVGRLLRVPADLFGLIEAAGAGVAGGAGDPGERLQRWLVLLAAHLNLDTRVLLTDAAGDRGLSAMLGGLLDATARVPARGTYLLWTIRDAALDNGDTALALRAQVEITRVAADEPREWIVLAEILALGEAQGAAADALAEALWLDPADEAAAERREALRAGAFQRFHPLAGFASPPRRILARAGNRPATPPALAIW